MQLSRATALIAVVLIVLLSAGYAAADRAEQETSMNSGPGPRIALQVVALAPN
jgi:hypothetical protein